ncbi:hypothetical protein POM88_045189 [Heracleum sosnowskyi]|uniref:TF-B3 domain-containing protein n=1 Tax=Heracleum sosnowskyi TaxID=360622 RepID=A0AAD8H6X0_9APIA|nr:hypothetical protein POM88_045189 [Heracleum sosnowskyi]
MVDSFCSRYRKSVDEKVYLYLPSSAIWFGSFVLKKHRIEGLQNFMRYYDVKPLNVFVLEYFGKSDFRVEIFNLYAIEIDYGLKTIPFENGKCTVNHVGGVIAEEWKSSEIEIDKINHMWHINLKWEKCKLLFDEEWFDFAKCTDLCEGDTCVFMVTPHPQKFEIAVFEKHSYLKINKAGSQQGKGILKFFKFMNVDTVLSGELEVPRLFVDEFGWMLHEDVNLILEDGHQYTGFFCKTSNLMIGLKPLFEKYSIDEHYVLFFEYIGHSTFFLTVYNNYAMSIFNHLFDKLLLADVLKKYEPELIVLSESSFDFVEDSNKMEFESHEPSGRQFASSSNAVCNVNSFTVVLKLSHVNQTGHGVYFGRNLFSLYRTWKNGKIVTLLCGGKSWEVAIHRKKKMCRFGKGWDDFTKDNDLGVGKMVTFYHVSGYTFHVSK